jgi:hypothetical protein
MEEEKVPRGNSKKKGRVINDDEESSDEKVNNQDVNPKASKSIKEDEDYEIVLNENE